MSDQQKYQDYVAYQNYVTGQGGAAAPTAPSAPEPSLLDKLKSLPKEAMDIKTAFDSRLMKAVSLGYIDPTKFPGGEVTAAAEKAHPLPALAGDISGNLVTGAGVGKLAGFLTKGKELGALARIARGTISSAAEAAARNPKEGETRVGNAIQAGTLASGLGAGFETIGKAGGIARYIGRKMSGLTAEEAGGYAADPAKAEELLKLQTTDEGSAALNKTLKDMIRGTKATGTKQPGALDKIKTYISGLRDQKMAAGRAGDLIEVEPNIFHGSEVEPRLQDMLTKESAYGKMTDPSRFTPEGKIKLTFDEVDELTRSASEAAKLKDAAAKVGQVSIKAGNADEGRLAATLKDAMETKNPKVAALNEALHDSLKHNSAIEQLGGNLGRLITPSTAPGSSSFRGLRNFIDKRGGTDLEGMSQGIAAARKLEAPTAEMEQLIPAARRIGGKIMIKGSSALRDAMQDPSLAPALTNILYGTDRRR